MAEKINKLPEIQVQKDAADEKELIIQSITDLKIGNKGKRHTAKNKADAERNRKDRFGVSRCEIFSEKPQQHKNQKQIVKIPQMTHLIADDQIAEKGIPGGAVKQAAENQRGKNDTHAEKHIGNP